MTKKLPNRLILEEGINEVILKRAGAEYEVVPIMVRRDGDGYVIDVLPTPILRLQFKDRKFVKLK